MDIKLKPCPFCGEAPKFWSCDRLITITCEKCNYRRAFDGIVGNKNTGIPIHYEGGKISTTEFYNRFAKEEAIEAWNRRVSDE